MLQLRYFQIHVAGNPFHLLNAVGSMCLVWANRSQPCGNYIAGWKDGQFNSTFQSIN